MFGHRLKRGAVVLCLAAVLALPVCAEGRITTDMTMKEIRSDPAIAGSGISTYIKGDADSLALRRLYENKTFWTMWVRPRHRTAPTAEHRH